MLTRRWVVLPNGGFFSVTADSDFVPAFKFARREGLRVYLAPLGHSVWPELKVHADVVLDLDMAGGVVAGRREIDEAGQT